MPLVTLLHNPTAGDEGHSAERLVSLIETAGYSCHYASIKEDGWKSIAPDTALIGVAGGDGTVRKVVSAMLVQNPSYPIALLPFGTANNIARSLRIADDPEKVIPTWEHADPKPVDIGSVKGLSEGNFFLESFGFGLLAALMKKMEETNSNEKDTPEEKIATARRLLCELTHSYEPSYCKIVIDGTDYSGEYLLVEILNMPFIGANLKMAPNGDPGDGLFDIVLIASDKRKAFADFVRGTNDCSIQEACPAVLQGRDIQLQWEGKDCHLDDELVGSDMGEISIMLKDSVLKFLT